MLAADTLASYGTMARYRDVRRLLKVGNNTLIGASGEISDFQSLEEQLENMHQDDVNQDDGYQKTPKEIFNYLRSMMYQRRNKGNPLWNQLVVAGYNLKSSSAPQKPVPGTENAPSSTSTAGEPSASTSRGPFLGYVDLIGTTYEENFIATGFGAYLAIPMIREKWHAELDEGDARALLEDCLRVCYYRDCKAFYRIQLAKATSDGEVVISEPYDISTSWETATFDARHPYGGSDGSSW